MATLTRRLPHRVERAFGVTGRYIYSLEWDCAACKTTTRRTVDFGDLDVNVGDEVQMTEICRASKCTGLKSEILAKVLGGDDA